MRPLFLLALLLAFAARATEPDVQRALVQRDQQSAEFDRKGSDALHARQLQEASQPLHPDPEVAKQLRPYQRERMARERKIGTDPISREMGSVPIFRALPLPGGPRHGVEPVALPRVGG
jgi:hypothetical protein